MWIVGLSRSCSFLCYALCYKTSQNCLRTKRGWTLALSEDLFSEWEERKKSRAERCRCACHPLQTHFLHTFSFILVSA